MPAWLVDARTKWESEPASSNRTAFYYSVAANHVIERQFLGATFIVGVRRKGDWHYVRQAATELPYELEDYNDEA